MPSVGLGVGGERMGVVEPELGVGPGLDVRQRPGPRGKPFQWGKWRQHSVAFPTICVISAWHLLKVLIRKKGAIRACSGGNTSKKKRPGRARGQGPQAHRRTGAQGQRATTTPTATSTANRQRGKETTKRKKEERHSWGFNWKKKTPTLSNLSVLQIMCLDLFLCCTIRDNQNEPQWIVAQRPFSALKILEVLKSSAKELSF